jgi:hypothetical protein
LILPGDAKEKDYSLLGWYRDGQRHRVSGPAIIRNGKSAAPAEEWWVRGRHIPDAEVREIIAKHELPGNHNEWSDNDAGVFSLAA